MMNYSDTTKMSVPETRKTTIGVGIVMLCVGTVLGAGLLTPTGCPNENCSTTDKLKACCNCSSWHNATSGSSCRYHETDVTAYCDCQSDRKCEANGTTYLNHTVVTWSGTCPGNGCKVGCYFTGSVGITNKANLTEYSGTPCS